MCVCVGGGGGGGGGGEYNKHCTGKLHLGPADLLLVLLAHGHLSFTIRCETAVSLCSNIYCMMQVASQKDHTALATGWMQKLCCSIPK